MKLTRVLYELFNSDDEHLSNVGVDAPHTIDREIHLVGEGGEGLYISWSSSPYQYCIGFDRSLFFSAAPESVRDVTESKIWSKIIGHQVVLELLDDDCQILAIRAGTTAVFCASVEEGKWGADVVSVFPDAPRLPPRLL